MPPCVNITCFFDFVSLCHCEEQSDEAIFLNPRNIFKRIPGGDKDYVHQPPDTKTTDGAQLKQSKSNMPHHKTVNPQISKDDGHDKGDDPI